jgi:hypothetical protein
MKQSIGYSENLPIDMQRMKIVIKMPKHQMQVASTAMFSAVC